MRPYRIMGVMVVALVLVVASASVAAAARRPGAGMSQPVVTGTVYSSESTVVPGATIAISVLGKTGYTPVTTITADAAGYWGYTDKTGDYRFEFSAYGFAPQTLYLSMPDKVAYTLDVTLQKLWSSISGHAYYGLSKLPMPNCMMAFFRQNTDGTWPVTTIAWSTVTDVDGAYDSGNLEPGVYRVRFFGMHTGAQWWEYVDTYAEATSVDISVPGTAMTGIDGWLGLP